MAGVVSGFLSVRPSLCLFLRCGRIFILFVNVQFFKKGDRRGDFSITDPEQQRRLIVQPGD